MKSFSQGQANIWHFGAFCGVDFNSGSPVTISGPINTIEGCATMCDSNGVLLFSTNGVTVYNSLGAVMATGLNGSQLSTQSALIIPYPGNLFRYYIFTVTAAAGVQGLNYSIVDMSLNAGLGGVALLNNPLLTPACEKITAVYDVNDTAIWVIAHAWGNNEFYAYKVTTTTVEPPVISAIGTIANSGNLYDGYLKASPGGTKLAACYKGVSGVNQLEVYDFNSATGIVSNAVSIPSPHENSYGACFSIDNLKLYITSTTSIDAIIQYDLSNINYPTNPIIIYNGGNIGFGGIQLAPDGKIYIAEDGTSSLSVINDPNALGAACNFTLNSLVLIGTSHIGLPDFFSQLFINNCSVYLGPDTSLCSSNLFSLNAQPDSNANYLWSNGSTTQTLTVDTSGIYWVNKTFPTGCIASDTIDVKFFPALNVSLGPDVSVCFNTPVLLDPGAGYISYHWSNSTANQTLSPITSGNYFVQVSDTNGCSDMDTVSVTFITPANPLPSNFSICVNDSLLLNPVGVFTNYEWSTGSNDSAIMIYSVGTYSVTVKDTFGCLTTDSILISLSTPSINIGNDTLFCGTFNFSLNAGSGFASYHWQNNINNQNLIIANPGNYSVTVTDIYGCTASDAIVITNSKPKVDIGNDTVICIHTTDVMIAASGFQNYLWSDGSTGQIMIVFSSGNYSVTVTDNKGCKASDSKQIAVDSPFVYIGRDTSTCNGSGIIFDAGNSFINYLWSTNSITQNISTTGAGIYSVTVTDAEGCTVADTAIISYSDCVDIVVPTGFTPNNDGHNDFFHILNSYDFKSAAIKIYNRWGQLIYETNNTNGYWNGKYNGVDCEVGVYVFVVSGKNYLEHDVFKKGTITLLR